MHAAPPLGAETSKVGPEYEVLTQRGYTERQDGRVMRHYSALVRRSWLWLGNPINSSSSDEKHLCKYPETPHSTTYKPFSTSFPSSFHQFDTPWIFQDEASTRYCAGFPWGCVRISCRTASRSPRIRCDGVQRRLHSSWHSLHVRAVLFSYISHYQLDVIYRTNSRVCTPVTKKKQGSREMGTAAMRPGSVETAS